MVFRPQWINVCVCVCVYCVYAWISKLRTVEHFVWNFIILLSWRVCVECRLCWVYLRFDFRLERIRRKLLDEKKKKGKLRGNCFENTNSERHEQINQMSQTRAKMMDHIALSEIWSLCLLLATMCHVKQIAHFATEQDFIYDGEKFR